ncbi:23637_t:CDS:2, partial [Gigaspora rosea]
FNGEIQQESINEMKYIQVQVQFWEDQNTKAWLYTLLMNSFNELYKDMYNPNITRTIFYKKAHKWLELFLIQSQGNVNSVGFICELYQLTDIIPYIHILVYHDLSL